MPQLTLSLRLEGSAVGVSRAICPVGSDTDTTGVAIAVTVMVCTVLYIAKHTLYLLFRVAGGVASHFVLFFHTFSLFRRPFVCIDIVCGGRNFMRDF